MGERAVGGRAQRRLDHAGMSAGVQHRLVQPGMSASQNRLVQPGMSAMDQPGMSASLDQPLGTARMEEESKRARQGEDDGGRAMATPRT